MYPIPLKSIGNVEETSRHVNEPSALIRKEKGFALVFLVVAAVCTLVKPYKVLNNLVSEFITAITYFSDSWYNKSIGNVAEAPRLIPTWATKAIDKLILSPACSH